MTRMPPSVSKSRTVPLAPEPTETRYRRCSARPKSGLPHRAVTPLSVAEKTRVSPASIAEDGSMSSSQRRIVARAYCCV
jgi:hypothetical protein